MPSTREIRRRIRSVKNTSQITHAMEMVAATKMRRAQSQALKGRPYSTTLDEELSVILNKAGELSHPLLADYKLLTTDYKIGVILLSTDRALCGALNTNIFRLVTSNQLPGTKFVFYTLGTKGRNFVAKTGADLQADFPNSEVIHFKNATQLRKLVVEDFTSGKINKAIIVYPHFVSTLVQEPKIVDLLPIQIKNGQKELETSKSESESILFDVPVISLLDYLLTHHLDTQIYQAMLETKASEHSARMIAMKNATDNAKELVSDLTLAYNGLRQAAITSELAEITTAGMALE